MIDLDAQVLAPNFAVWSEANRGNPMPAYTPPGSMQTSAIDGIFRIPSLDVLGLTDGPGMTTRKPMLDIRASQVPPGVNIVQNGMIMVRGVAYVVTDVRPDGDGLIVLALSEA